MKLHFDNRFVRELPADALRTREVRQVHGAAYSLVEPTPVRAPNLLAWSPEAAALLDLSEQDVLSNEFVAAFAGNRLLAGMEPFAACYGGHQFGHWAGQLGDGRAISLGEAINLRGERWELQLKGAGPTPYSRRADGRAVLRSSLREFLCSEAMHHLGVPTTRALCLIGSGEPVMRDMFYDGRPRPEPGAIVCRMAPSFLRFGNFELPTARGDHALLLQLVDFCIARDFPTLAARGTDVVERRLRWFDEIVSRTAVLIAHWMRVGFVHGVMNTDNMSILGLTIDYGPYGWIDDYDPDWTPNTTDAEGRRYRFGTQAEIAHWNLWQLANAIYPAIEDASALEAVLNRFPERYQAEYRRQHQARLGLLQWQGESDDQLLAELYRLLQIAQLDLSIFFRLLARVEDRTPAAAHFAPACYMAELAHSQWPVLEQWLERYRARLAQEGQPAAQRQAQMDAVNPCYLPRNYLAQQAIEAAEAGDLSVLERLLDVLRQPYVEQPGAEAFAARRPEWARHKAGCSMLSCSS